MTTIERIEGRDATPTLTNTSTLQAIASVTHLTGPEPSKAQARDLIFMITPELWNTPSGDDRSNQVRRTLSALLHKDVAQDQVDDLLEAYDKIHHMEFGGCLEHIYGKTQYDRTDWVQYEKERLEDAVNNMTWGLGA